MPPGTSILSWSTLALAAAIFVGIPIRGQSAAQNNSNGKHSAQIDSKSAGKSSAQAPSATGSIERRIKDYLRKWYAWGPDLQAKVGPVQPSPAGNGSKVPIEVTAQGGSNNAV